MTPAQLKVLTDYEDRRIAMAVYSLMTSTALELREAATALPRLKPAIDAALDPPQPRWRRRPDPYRSGSF